MADKIDKKYELLKFKFENSRVWTLTCLALLISSFIGASALKSINPEASKVLFQVAGIFIFGSLIFWIFTFLKGNRIEKYLKD